MSTKGVAVFGDLNLDTRVHIHNFPISCGDTMFSVDGIGDNIGGAATNVACGLRALDCKVSFGSVVGADNIGQLVLDRVIAKGLNTDFIRRDWPTTSRTTVLVDAQGNRQCINDPKLANKYHYPITDTHQIIEPYEWVFASTQNWCRHVLREAKHQNRKVVVDVQALTEIDDYHRDFFQYADVVILSSERLKIHSHELIRQLWYEFDIELVVVTHGRGGATLGERNGENLHWESAYEVGPVIDTTGAGDAFVAGFLSSLLEHGQCRLAMTYGQIFAAHKIMTKGSTNGYPSLQIMNELLRRFSA